MRLCIRTLLLTVALLSTVPSSAEAGCCIPIFDPFHWLFGCGGYQGCCPPPAYGNPGFGGYQPAYPGVMQPCAPCAPAYPLQGLFRPVPAPAIFQHALDPCGSQCQPMMAYQPQPMPIAMPVVQQYMPPAPMMAAPAMGCDGGCGGIQESAMMPEMAAPMIAAEPGCCGDAGPMMGGYPQPAMAYSGYGMQNWAAAQPAMAWTPQGPGYPGYARDSSLPPSGLGFFVRPRIARRDTRRMIRTWRRMDIPNMYGGNNRRGPFLVPRPYAYPMPMYPQAGYAPGYAPAAYPQMMYSQPMVDPMAYSQMPAYPQTAYQNQPMPMQGMWSPSAPAWSAPQAAWAPDMNGAPMVAGDIMGDHEYAAPATAMAPVSPISFNGAVPVRRTSMSRPLVTTSSQYTKSVR